MAVGRPWHLAHPGRTRPAGGASRHHNPQPGQQPDAGQRHHAVARGSAGRPARGTRHRLRQYRRPPRSVRGDAAGADAARVGEPDHTRWPRGRDVLDMATRNGAAVLGLENQAGRIAVGQLADLVLVRCRTAGTLALEPGADALVQHGGPEWVDSVMVDGRWVMRGGVLLAFDEAAALADAEAAIAALHQRTAAQLAMLDEALPALAQALPGTDSS